MNEILSHSTFLTNHNMLSLTGRFNIKMHLFNIYDVQQFAKCDTIEIFIFNRQGDIEIYRFGFNTIDGIIKIEHT